jgi:two-component system chemotaxis response regulator CheB
MRYEAVVIGASAGGLQALRQLLSALPASFPMPIAIVQHIGERSDFMADYLNQASRMLVKEAEDKEPLHAGTAYLAPAQYHLLVEPEQIFSLSVDPRVQYSRPSIDVLFESAAAVYGPNLIGIVLTGANSDGAEGLRIVKQNGGLAIVQSPANAASDAMPRAALAATKADYVANLDELAPLLLQLTMGRARSDGTNG